MHNTAISFDSVLEQYAGVPVLVTGASGFIGRWVAHFLTLAGAELYLPTRDSAAAKTIFTEYKIKGKIFKLDLLDTSRLQRTIDEIGPVVTFNLAGYGIDRSEFSKDLSRRINSLLPEYLCEAIAETKAPAAWTGARLVHTGTAMEYGAVAGDLREDSDTCPTSLYGSTKLAGTAAVSSVCKRKTFSALTARLFSVYGPGESSQRLLPSLIDAASNQSGRIELTAGLHRRDFVYVEDVAEALLRLGLSETTPGEVVNVATGTLLPVRSFAEMATKILGMQKDRLSFGALSTRPEEMNHDPVNINRLVEKTGWRPTTNLNEGLWKTLTKLRIDRTAPSGAGVREAACELF
jgi:UDP-glucose 4-epimerase